MKKLTIILFTFLFILTSCSNPEDTKKIEELEKQVQENNLKEKEFIFNKNIECKNIKINYNDITQVSYTSNSVKKYSEVQDACIFYIEDRVADNYYIYNYFTNEQLYYEKCNTVKLCKTETTVNENGFATNYKIGENNCEEKKQKQINDNKECFNEMIIEFNKY